MRKSKTLPPPPRNIMSANCTTCGDPIAKESKRCKVCFLVLLPSGDLGRVLWFPKDTIPVDDPERLS